MSEVVSPAPVSTTVLWDAVVGAQLEELLYGLLDAMGAKELVWRAGSNSGVSASDNGRDLEAVFVQPTPDGEEDRTRWWIESKGRGSTVPRDEVTAAVNNLTARNDIDIFVFCTNSRFSNPTRDWVAEWQKNHPRPKIRLWDRDTLDRLVREHPTVAARTLPEALDDTQRLKLLVHRFWRLGETPTGKDLDYFWERQSVVMDSEDKIEAITMFVYAESSDHGLCIRPWGTLISDTPYDILQTLYLAIFDLPRSTIASLARPLENEPVNRTAAYLVMTVMPYWPADKLHDAMNNLGRYLDDDHPLNNPKLADFWASTTTTGILGRIQDELADQCTDDCARISSEPRRVCTPPLLGKEYWRKFGLGEEPDSRILTIYSWDKPCVVGFPLDNTCACPLLEEPENSVKRLEELCRVIDFRRENPENQRWIVDGPPDLKALLGLTTNADTPSDGEDS